MVTTSYPLINKVITKRPGGLLHMDTVWFVGSGMFLLWLTTTLIILGVFFMESKDEAFSHALMP